MFRKKSINEINRSWRNLIFLIVFVSLGFGLSGLSQIKLNESKKPAPVTVVQEKKNVEENYKLIKVQPVKHFPYLKKLLIF